MHRIVLLVAAFALAACDSVTEPHRPSASAGLEAGLSGSSILSILARYNTAFERLVPAETSFVAVKGEAADFVLRFPGHDDPVLELKLSSSSLQAYPNGAPMASGDRVTISISKDSSGRILFYFGPSGLRFSPLSPAQLTIWYAHANPDVNGDGVVNATDVLLENAFGLFRQELPKDPWQGIPALNLTGLHRVQTSIGGFTGYSVGD